MLESFITGAGIDPPREQVLWVQSDLSLSPIRNQPGSARAQSSIRLASPLVCRRRGMLNALRRHYLRLCHEGGCANKTHLRFLFAHLQQRLAYRERADSGSGCPAAYRTSCGSGLLTAGATLHIKRSPLLRGRPTAVAIGLRTCRARIQCRRRRSSRCRRRSGWSENRRRWSLSGPGQG